MTCGDRCNQITSNGMPWIVALGSTHVKADKLMFLHAAHAATHGYNSVLIGSYDIDGLIMCLTFHEVTREILVQTCVTKAPKYILDVEKIAKSVGTNVYRSLIGMRAYIGCDIVSTYAETRHLRPLKLIGTNKNMQDSCAKLGEEWIATE